MGTVDLWGLGKDEWELFKGLRAMAGASEWQGFDRAG